VPVNHEYNAITKNALVKWLERHIDPDNHILDITGGEPGLHPEIKTIIPALDEMGYHGIIRTNGTTPIPKSKTFQLITAWHEGCGCPTHYDQVLILTNPNENWKEKIEKKKKNEIPYKVSLFTTDYLTGSSFDTSLCKKNKIIECTYMNNQGLLSCCSSEYPKQKDNIFEMTPPVYMNLVNVEVCSKCKSIGDIENYLPDNLRNKVQKDFEDYLKEKFNAKPSFTDMY
jgi:hypothetical protein